MILSEFRARLGIALQQLIDGELSNDEFDQLEPKDLRDRALYEIWRFGHSLYNDICEYRLSRKNSISSNNRMIAHRCVLFLSTNLEYEWSTHPVDFPRRKAFSYRTVAYILFSICLFFCLFLCNVSFGTLIASIIVLWSLFPIVTQIKPSKIELEAYWLHGDGNVWPFLRRSDCQQACEHSMENS